uniref:twin-arginine translocation signal domain-containing protein n=1 Tax=Slackia piriformis TaxID=626934 RepID=UPI0023F23F16
MELNRRDFLKGAVVASGAGAIAGLVGCAPKSEQPTTSGTDGSAAAAFEEATAPIEPATMPDSWDEEHEIIVVGS